MTVTGRSLIGNNESVRIPISLAATRRGGFELVGRGVVWLVRGGCGRLVATVRRKRSRQIYSERKLSSRQRSRRLGVDKSSAQVAVVLRSLRSAQSNVVGARCSLQCSPRRSLVRRSIVVQFGTNKAAVLRQSTTMDGMRRRQVQDGERRGSSEAGNNNQYCKEQNEATHEVGAVVDTGNVLSGGEEIAEGKSRSAA